MTEGLGIAIALVTLAGAWLAWRARRTPEPTFLDGCLPYAEGTIPPPGWGLVEIEGKGLHWVDPTTLRASARRHELTPAQVEAIRAFKEILGDNDPTTLEEAVDNFSRDRDPDREIALWQHVAAVWSSEVATREISDPSQARLLYLAVLGCSLVEPTPDALLAWNPRMKAISDLAGLTARYRAGPAD